MGNSNGEGQCENETMIRVKWWQVMLVVIGIFGFFFVTIINHEHRITTQETEFSNISSTLNELKEISKESRQEQLQLFKLIQSMKSK